MSKLFSILTAGYNNEAYLQDWYNSIVAQDYRPLEVVYYNDASTDATSFALREGFGPSLRSKGIQFRQIDGESRVYYASCLSRLTEAATGDFFGILDSDDAISFGSVSHVMRLYDQNPDIGWIYTQFEICDKRMETKKKGFSAKPAEGQSLLSEGKRGRHTYSHWRTYSRRVPRLRKLFKEGQRCAVDKYMGYRLEEQIGGMFSPRVCYRWRTGTGKSISDTEPSKLEWHKTMNEAYARRKKFKIKTYPVIAAPKGVE